MLFLKLAALAACLFIVSDKWGIMAWWDRNRPTWAWFGEPCDFCRSFWLSALCWLVLAPLPVVWSDGVTWLTDSLAATPLTWLVWSAYIYFGFIRN